MKTQTSGASAASTILPSLVFPAAVRGVLRGSIVREKSGTKYGWVFVAGAFPQKAVDDLRKAGYDNWLNEARDAYLANRKNGVEGDSPATPFPGDGAYSWDAPESEVSSAIRYTEGPQDKAWMEARDRKYVFRLEQEGLLDDQDKGEPNLKREVPKLYAKVMAKRQARLAEEKMAQETEARQAEQARAAAVKREQEARDKAQKAAEQQAKAAAEAKAKKDADAARARQQAEETAAAAKKLEEDLLYARKQYSMGSDHWMNKALSTFQKILSHYPHHFEALCFVAKIALKQKGRAAIDDVKQTVLERLKEVPENQKALYVEVVNALVLQLLETGAVEQAQQALLVCETALHRLPQEPSLLQSQQQAVSRMTARSKNLQDKATRGPTADQPPYSPRTHYHFFREAMALEEKIQAYTGQEGKANLIFLQREMQDLAASIADLPAESLEVTAARETRLQQELRVFEENAVAKLLLEGAAVTEQKLESDSRDFVSERVRQWQAANAGAVDVDAHPFEDDLEAAMGMSVMTAEFRSTDCNLIANELVKRICCQGTFSIRTEPDEYIEIRCNPDKVEAIVAQAMKVTLSKLFNNIRYPDNQTIRLPWEQLSDKQVRKFETLFAREKQDIRLASIQDAGEDIKSGVNGVARRVAPTP